MALVTDLDTPAVTVRLDVVERNIRRVHDHLARHGIANRPHVKTHKIPALGKLQMAAGAVGITCQKLGEVEVFTDAGVADDVLLTFNVVGRAKIERLLADHRLYLETEYHEGHRANFASADLTGRDFSGLNLRGIKMDRAVLRGADFTRAQLQRANLIGVISLEARFDRADLSGARLSGANLVSASLENACLAKADMEFALMAKVLLRGACLYEADMSGAQLDGAVLTRAELRKANLRGAGFRNAQLDEADLRGARLGGAFLVGASLRGANLRGAYLRLAKLDGADLSDANLYNAEGLTQAQLELAHCNSGTKLPEGLRGAEDAKG